MTQREYSADVEKELLRLSQLTQTRLEAYLLESISVMMNHWQEGVVPAKDALEEIKKLMTVKMPDWAKGADPGMPVAQAVADGILTRADMNSETWSSIEYLVTLVGI